MARIFLQILLFNIAFAAIGAEAKVMVRSPAHLNAASTEQGSAVAAELGQYVLPIEVRNLAPEICKSRILIHTFTSVDRPINFPTGLSPPLD